MKRIENAIALLEDYLEWGKRYGDGGSGVDDAIALLLEFVKNYDNRLISDLIAILTHIQLSAQEQSIRWYCGRVDGKSDDVVLLETLDEIIKVQVDTLREKNYGKD